MEDDISIEEITDNNVENNVKNNIGEDQGKNKANFPIGLGSDKRGGCGLVVGSALVIGVLMAAFVFLRNKKRRDSNKSTTASQQFFQGLRSVLPSSWKDKQASEDSGDSSMDLKSNECIRRHDQDSEDGGDSSSSDSDSSMEPDSPPASSTEVHGDEMPEQKEAETKTQSRENDCRNDATEKSMTVDHEPLNPWLRILSVMVFALFLLWIFPFLVKLCMRFSPGLSLAVHAKI